MNIGWLTKYILALSEDFLIHRWKLSGTMGLAHGFHLSNKKMDSLKNQAFRLLLYHRNCQEINLQA
jgi:hypothetical protein